MENEKHSTDYCIQLIQYYFYKWNKKWFLLLILFAENNL